MGNDLGRGGIGFEGAGLIGGFFLRFMAEKLGYDAALARLADMLEYRPAGPFKRSVAGTH
jgi:hypothetical protein